MISNLSEDIERYYKEAKEKGNIEKAIKVVKSLLAKGMPSDFIAEVTELNIGEIAKLNIKSYLNKNKKP